MATRNGKTYVISVKARNKYVKGSNGQSSILDISSARLHNASTKPNGYGQLTYRMRRVMAHRLAWIARHGPIPKGLEVCHRCDERRCCRTRARSSSTSRDPTARRAAPISARTTVTASGARTSRCKAVIRVNNGLLAVVAEIARQQTVIGRVQLEETQSVLLAQSALCQPG